MARFHSFLRLSNIPLYIYTPHLLYPFIQWWTLRLLGDTLPFPTILFANLSPSYPVKDYSYYHSVSQLSIAVGSTYILAFLSIRKHPQNISLSKRDMPHKDDYSDNLLQNILENLGNIGHLFYWFDTIDILLSAPLIWKKALCTPAKYFFDEPTIRGQQMMF